MKGLQYFFNYLIIMLIGFLIKYIGLTDVFNMPYYVLILYDFLAIEFGIKKPLEKNRNVKYRDIRTLLIILSTILNTILVYLSYWNFVSWVLLSVSNILILIFIKPNYEKIEEETGKNIKEYFEKK